MKVRLGFVANSSSSSFIFALPGPLAYTAEKFAAQFNLDPSELYGIHDGWDQDFFKVQEVASYIGNNAIPLWEDFGQIGVDQIFEILCHGNATYPEVASALKGEDIPPYPLNYTDPLYIDNVFQGDKLEGQFESNRAMRDAFYRFTAKLLWKKFSGKRVYAIEVGDHHALGNAIEHGPLFNAVEHIRISLH